MELTKAHMFIAVPVPEGIKQQLNTFCVQLQQNFSFKKWVFPDDYHITLKFLGRVDKDTLESLKPLIALISSKMAPYSLSLEGLNTFGKLSSPRILWVGVKGDLNPLNILQGNIDEASASLGFVSENRPYTPHLTIAKNYAGQEKFDAGKLEQAAQQLQMSHQWVANEVVLYQTHLGREPMYEPIEVYDM